MLIIILQCFLLTILSKLFSLGTIVMGLVIWDSELGFHIACLLRLAHHLSLCVPLSMSFWSTCAE